MESKAEFITRFGSIFEHSPWVAERAYPAVKSTSAASVHQAMVEVFHEASESERLAVLRAHPDLAGKLAAAQTLTAESSSEQTSAGLDALTDDERLRFTVLNESYVARFGFPFIIAVRGLNKVQILAAFETRIRNTPHKEFETACAQVEKIARLRLETMLP
jgi:2-oxo-4-hydroxy-4-carboxy-5-ureidoimidazoline decarboxylase